MEATMTEQEQRIAIAEICGWKRPSDGTTEYWWDGKNRYSVHISKLPDYIHDLNAMQSAVLSQPPEFRARFNELQENVCITRKCIMAELLAEDWAILFLQVKRDMAETSRKPKDQPQ
jgi:hypothetical protein